LETEFQTTDIHGGTTLTQDDRKLYCTNSFKYGPGGIRKMKNLFTFASLLTVGLLANCTSVALRIVFSSKMVA
jgi:hypothetical protein